MLKLKNLNESFEKLYNTDSSLNESVILTEAFNESFPSWLKTAIIKSRNEFGYTHRQTRSTVHNDYRNSSYSQFKSRRGDRKSPRNKSLFTNALKAGFFNVTVHEAEVPTTARQVVKDPYIPIWGLASGQVYIPGFNNLEKSSYSGKAFESMPAKALIDEAVHYAYFDKNELDPQGYDSIIKERDDRLASQQVYYKEHPNEYNLYKNTAGEARGDWKVQSDKEDYQRYGHPGYHPYKKWDKSGYNVDISALKERVRALKGTKAKQIAIEWGEDLQKCFKLFKRVIRQQDVFELSDVFEKFSTAFPIFIEDYHSLVKSLEQIEKDYDYDQQTMIQQLGRRVDRDKESIQQTKDFLAIFEGVDPYKDASEVDWLS